MSLRQQQAVTSQVILCRLRVAQITKIEPAGYIHTCLDTAQLPATNTLPMSADKAMAQMENPTNFHSWERTQESFSNKSCSSEWTHGRVQNGNISHLT